MSKAVDFDGALTAAPLAGYTDIAFRELCLRYGAKIAVTEMVSVNGLNYGNNKTAELMRIGDYESPSCVQLFGSEPEAFSRAADNAYVKAFDVVDVNMGCPMPKVTKTGAGSALLKDIPRAAKIVEALASKLPCVTVKVRLGFKNGENLLGELLPALERAGAKAVTVHGRYAEQRYEGFADYAPIYEAAAKVSIPILGNGDIKSRADVKARLIPPLSGLAIGRGALADPSIFSDESVPRSVTLKAHLELLQKYFPEPYALLSIKKHAAYSLKNMSGGKAMRIAIFSAKTIDEAAAVLARLPG